MALAAAGRERETGIHRRSREAIMPQAFTPAILIHLGAAIAALLIGCAVFLRRKGTSAHRTLGRLWVALMLVTSISTYWIRGDGGFSWIHLLSIVVPALLALGVYFALTGNFSAHRKTMTNLYFGALIIAGAFSLLPQRLLGQMLWSAAGLT